MEQVRMQEEKTEQTEQGGGFLRMPKYYLAGVRQLKAAERCDFCGDKIKNVVVVHKAGVRNYNAGFECIKQLDMLPFDKKQAKNRLKKLKKLISFLEKECRLIVLHGHDCYMYREFNLEILREFVYKNVCKDYEYTCSSAALLSIVKDLNTKVYNINPDWQSVEFMREVMKTVNPTLVIADFGHVDTQKKRRKEILKEIFG